MSAVIIQGTLGSFIEGETKLGLQVIAENNNVVRRDASYLCGQSVVIVPITDHQAAQTKLAAAKARTQAVSDAAEIEARQLRKALDAAEAKLARVEKLRDEWQADKRPKYPDDYEAGRFTGQEECLNQLTRALAGE